uniref:Sema domain-containing protein n=1 Tax=Plectus sambesii TaxID=2011161 RepID=A0A914WT31_9BILA
MDRAVVYRERRAAVWRAALTTEDRPPIIVGRLLDDDCVLYEPTALRGRIIALVAGSPSEVRAPALAVAAAIGVVCRRTADFAPDRSPPIDGFVSDAYFVTRLLIMYRSQPFVRSSSQCHPITRGKAAATGPVTGELNSCILLGMQMEFPLVLVRLAVDESRPNTPSTRATFRSTNGVKSRPASPKILLPLLARCLFRSAYSPQTIDTRARRELTGFVPLFMGGDRCVSLQRRACLPSLSVSDWFMAVWMTAGGRFGADRARASLETASAPYASAVASVDGPIRKVQSETLIGSCHNRHNESCGGMMLLVALLVGVVVVATGAAEDHVVNVFQVPDVTARFLNLAMDDKTQQLYVGAVNHIYQVDASDLKMVADVSTGPQPDSHFCNWDGQCIEPQKRGNPAAASREGRSTNSTKHLSDNSNKILLVYAQKKVLIACGTLLQGVCELHRLDDIRTKVPQTSPLVPVAANSANASTVAFVGDVNDEKRLFVAATYTYEHYRDAFPSVCTRRLDEDGVFDLVDRGSIEGESSVHIRAEFKSQFRVTYVGGFQHEHFAYWGSMQRKQPIGSATTNPFISKLIRVCTGDTQYVSYSEIEVQCRGTDNSNYNLMRALIVADLGKRTRADMEPPAGEDERFLIGIFEKGTDPDKPEPGRAAVCVYPMSKVKMTFWYNIDRCRSGTGTYSLPHLGRDRKCPNMANQPLSEDTCDLGVGGSIELDGVAVVEYQDAQLTSVASQVVADQSVLLLGTRDGQLKKLLLDSRRAKEYAHVQLSALRAPIVPGMLLSADGSHLFAMAGNQLYKVRTAACAQHGTCATCTQSGDPFCGWCTLEKRCSTRTECKHTGFIASSDKQATCPRLIGQLSPQNASTFESPDTLVSMRVAGLPAADTADDYKCVFGDGELAATTDARFEAPDRLSCPLPGYDARPKLPKSGVDHVIVPLKIFSTKTSTAFFEERFFFYDCGAHRLCTTCSASRWPCQWCLIDNRCVHSTSLCTNKTATRGETQCPHIDKTSLKDGKILIADNHASSIRLPVINLDALLNQEHSPVSVDKLECSMTVEGRLTKVRGHLREDGWVECESRSYTYEQQVATLDVNLFLTAGGSFVIDKTTVTLYKCRLLHSDCSRCLTLDPMYQCTWCGGGCNFREFCPVGSLPDRETADSICDRPVVESFEPMSGPLEGGTRVTITGRDLGTRMDDVRDKVFVAGRVPCRVVDYEVSVKVVCITEGALEPYSGPVKITLGPTGRRSVESTAGFRFVDPAITSIYPPFGPVSGGTRLTIHGTGLDVGGVVKAFVGQLPCRVIDEEITADHIVCITAASSKPHTLDQVVVQIDGANRTLRTRFEYLHDPVVTSVTPLASFQSGGRLLLVRGANLQATLRPKIYLIDPVRLREASTSGDKPSNGLPPLASELGECTPENATVMWCRSPRIDQRARARRGVHQAEALLRGTEQADLSSYPRWPLGFQMDGVSSVANLGDLFQLTIVPDPEFFSFNKGAKVYRGDGEEPLVLDGQYLSLAAAPLDVQVFVGAERCNVTVVAMRQLVCKPPRVQPIATDDKGQPVGGNRPMVVVLVGAMRFELGLLAYEKDGALFGPAGGSLSVNPAVLGGFVAGVAAFLVFVLIVVAVCWRRKSWQAEKDYKRIQLQMDNLESNVRQECKQAFAELQTDMSDLTSDLVALGIPYHSRRSFACRVLFKDEHQQALLVDWHQQQLPTPGNGYSTHLHIALAQFESLLWNKQFVVTLVDTLERQPTFSAQDRVYVASLLTATLARNMQYCTEVVMTLLSQLIDKSVSGKFPQLMLRRTESVVEKMLANWIALCLYDYMQGEAGESLFLLYRALKHQAEKGPVDAVTGEARYSLSEDRLLKEAVETNVVQIFVIPPAEEDGRSEEMVACRVLLCDTISQVKSKILDTLYRNTPFSARPTIQEVDLEWRCPRRGAITLSDDDRSQPKDGYKRLNTVGYYSIPPSAVLALLPRHPGTFTYRSSSSQTYCSLSSSAQLIPTGQASPENSEKDSTKYYHLVPPSTQYLCSSGTMSRKRREQQQKQAGSNQPKAIPEIYLTRLLTSKGTVQKFVDDFFDAALRVCPERFPPVVKYLFDFMEHEAQKHQISDPSVVYAWKNNALPLRFWVNVIKNPEFVFDIEKSRTVDACLSVVAQTFMDACSASEPRLGKDSPSNKLLFAKDIPRYRHKVAAFYRDVRALPPISDQQLNACMTHMSRAYAQEFNVLSSVRELLTYVVKFSCPITTALSTDQTAQRHRLSERLENVILSMSGGGPYVDTEHVYATVT